MSVAVGGEMVFTALEKTVPESDGGCFYGSVPSEAKTEVSVRKVVQTNKLSGCCSVASLWKRFCIERRCRDGHSLLIDA